MTASYALITPARNEEENLGRLADSLAAQRVLPAQWVIVENGSTDGTLRLAEDLAARHAWITVVVLPTARGLARGGPIVRAVHAGLKALQRDVDVVVKLDADVSMGPEHFETLLAVFAGEPDLGVASGTLFDDATGGAELHLTGDHVWGAVRAYRKTTLDEILPLEERMGWDTVDELKAAARGWRTRIVHEATFQHHRLEGERDGSRWRAWAAQGDVAWFVHYRPTYLLTRVLYRALREPSAFAMLTAYARAALRREARLADARAVALLRDQQRMRRLPARVAEAFGRR